MIDQTAFQWPGADETCQKCHGHGNIYYLTVKRVGSDVIGGKRVPCPVCAGMGTVRVPVQAPSAGGDAVKLE